MAKVTDLVLGGDTSVLTIKNYETDLVFGRVIQNFVFGEFVSYQYSNPFRTMCIREPLSSSADGPTSTFN